MSGTEEEPGVIPAAIEQVFNHIEEVCCRSSMRDIALFDVGVIS